MIVREKIGLLLLLIPLLFQCYYYHYGNINKYDNDDDGDSNKILTTLKQ